MAGYTRNDTSNNIATGNVINAADLDGEFDALVAAFHASTGHTHDGTAANGAPITKIGPVQDLVISTGAITPKTDNTVDLGSSSFEFKDLYIDGTANIDALVADTADINAGTIDGVVIGGSTTAAGSFTTLTTSSTVTLNGGTANGVLYLNGSKVATSGSSLQFNGTNFYTTAQIIGGAGSANANIIASSTVTNGGAGFSQFLFGNASTDTRGYLSYSHAAEAILFGTSGTEQMRLTSTGLGIGTSSPLVKFDVKGTTDTHVGITASGIDEAIILAFDDGGIRTPNLSYAAASHKFLCNTTETMRLDASGNLGLGVTPSAWGAEPALELRQAASLFGFSGTTNLLQNAFYNGSNWIYKNSAGAMLFQVGRDGHRFFTAPSGTAGNAITFTQAMTLDASGNLSVGTTSNDGWKIQANAGPTSIRFDYERQTYNSIFGFLGHNGDSGGVELGNINNSSDRSIRFSNGTSYAGRTERARITSGGYFKASDDGVYAGSANTWHEFNQSANSIGLAVIADNASFTSTVVEISAARNTTNNSYYFLDCAVSGVAYRLRVADSGDVTNANNSYGGISDAKMKTDIVDAGSQWADIKALRFRKFKMKDDPSGLVQLGVVAQEVELTSPGLVDEHTDRDAEGNDLGTTTKSVKTSVLLMKAAVALQEAMARIETLEAKVAQLEGTQP